MVRNFIQLVVPLAERSYPIYIGTHLLQQDLLAPHIEGQQVLVVTNQTVAPLYLPQVKQQLAAFQCNEVILPDGEEYKTLESVELIFDALVNYGHRRNTTLIALGGGVIGDMTGFAAACYQRGANFIQVPTTLLSQVDASVGGKTAVNHPKAKNMIGAFYQPKAVLIDIATLRTLPSREFNSGLAEIIKAALISDASFFAWLEEQLPMIMAKDSDSLVQAISTACQIKAAIVGEDEYDRNRRSLLNLGHTFGHALEQILGYGTWHHGEAVAVGIVLAADYSRRVKWLDEKSVERIKNILTMAKLPIRFPNSISAEQLMESMSADKKKETSKLKLVLLKEIGQAVLSSEIDLNILNDTISSN